MNSVYQLKNIYASLSIRNLRILAQYHGLEDANHNDCAWMLALKTFDQGHKKAHMANSIKCDNGICEVADDNGELIARIAFSKYHVNSVSKVYPTKYKTLSNTIEKCGIDTKKIVYYDRIDIMDKFKGKGLSTDINKAVYRKWSDDGFTHVLLKDQADKKGYWNHQIVQKGIGIEIAQSGLDSLYLIDLNKGVALLVTE